MIEEVREEVVNMVDKLTKEQLSYEAKQSAAIKNIFLLLEGKLVEKLMKNDTDVFETTVSLPLDKMGMTDTLLNRFCNDETIFMSVVGVLSLILGCVLTILITTLYSVYAERLLNRIPQ